MFAQMAKNKIKENIRNKMINGKLVLNETEIIKLINEYTNNEFNITLGTDHGENIASYGNVELEIRELK